MNNFGLIEMDKYFDNKDDNSDKKELEKYLGFIVTQYKENSQIEDIYKSDTNSIKIGMESNYLDTNYEYI